MPFTQLSEFMMRLENYLFCRLFGKVFIFLFLFLSFLFRLFMYLHESVCCSLCVADCVQVVSYSLLVPFKWPNMFHMRFQFHCRVRQWQHRTERNERIIGPSIKLFWNDADSFVERTANGERPLNQIRSFVVSRHNIFSLFLSVSYSLTSSSSVVFISFCHSTSVIAAASVC